MPNEYGSSAFHGKRPNTPATKYAQISAAPSVCHRLVAPCAPLDRERRIAVVDIDGVSYGRMRGATAKVCRVKGRSNRAGDACNLPASMSKDRQYTSVVRRACVRLAETCRPRDAIRDALRIVSACLPLEQLRWRHEGQRPVRSVRAA